MRGFNFKGVKINFSNRWLYTFIVIGILALTGISVYALAPNIDTTKGYHESSQVSVSIGTTEKTLQEAIDAGDFGGAGLWTASGSDIYYDGGNVGIGTSTPSNFLGWPGALQVNGEIRAARYYDDDSSYYLDINTNSYMNNLEVKGNLKVDGAITAPEGTLRDNGGGWVRTYGKTGWYSQTYDGGWFMKDTSWVRSYKDKNIYTAGQMQAGTLKVSGTIVNNGASCASSQWGEMRRCYDFGSDRFICACTNAAEWGTWYWKWRRI